jgi:chromosome segregation ATPase
MAEERVHKTFLELKDAHLTITTLKADHELELASWMERALGAERECNELKKTTQDMEVTIGILKNDREVFEKAADAGNEEVGSLKKRLLEYQNAVASGIAGINKLKVELHECKQDAANLQRESYALKERAETAERELGEWKGKAILAERESSEWRGTVEGWKNQAEMAWKERDELKKSRINTPQAYSTVDALLEAHRKKASVVEASPVPYIATTNTIPAVAAVPAMPSINEPIPSRLAIAAMILQGMYAGPGDVLAPNYLEKAVREADRLIQIEEETR